MEPGARVSLQYDRLYVENEVYLYNDIEQKVERMIMGRGSQPDSLATPRGGGGGGRLSRLRGAAGSRAGGELETGQCKTRPDTEQLTEVEAEIIQTGEADLVMVVTLTECRAQHRPAGGGHHSQVRRACRAGGV